MPPQRKAILHLDLDAFYVSAEVLADPRLRGLPVVVGADPEGGRGRGVVVTCSYEARKFGLRSGMPISQAYRLCPDAEYIRPNWPLYERTSEDVMSTLRKFADKFEQASIDEAFLDVTSVCGSEESAKAYALKVKEAVRNTHGLTCSIGVAPNKSSAKIASDMKKPDGLTVVPFNDVSGFLSPLPVGVVPGIGPKTRAFLKERGIETISQLQSVEGKQLLNWFGKNGVWLWSVVHGEERIEVRQQEVPKSLSVERTFKEDATNFTQVREEAMDAVSELIRRVKSSGYTFRVGGVKIRFRGFETHTREKTLLSRTDSEETLRETAETLLTEFKETAKPVRLIGVRVSDIQRSSAGPSKLDDWAS